MPTYIALFRAINVGGKNSLPMKELAALLEKNGYQNIKTYIQSGNVVFNSKKKPDADIGSLIEQQFGFKPEVIILSDTEFHSVAGANPYKNSEGKTVHTYFCKNKPNLNQKRLGELKAESEQVTIKDKVLYLHAPDGIGKSKLVANISSCLGVPATGRNLNTVNKLLSMIEDIIH